VEVRAAAQGDADAVADAFIPSFESLSFLPTLHSHEEHRSYIRDRVARGEVWVAIEGGRIVGMATLADGVLGHLYVHPDAQGQGAGSALLDRAKQLYPDGFTFWVFQQNDSARGFYEHRGCRLVLLTDGSGNEERTPDALYEWRPDGR